MNGNMDVRNLAQMEPFVTKDGSEIRELLAHRNSAIRHQSLAEARLAPGASTQEHYHLQTEEIYYITHGVGRIRIDGEMRRSRRRRDRDPSRAAAQTLERRPRGFAPALLLCASLRA